MSWRARGVALGLMILGWPAAVTQAQAPGPLCSGVPCVFQYRGDLTPAAIDSPTGAWVKEVELADLDDDGWLDVYLMQKQPLVPQGTKNVVQPGNNLDLIYMNQPSFVSPSTAIRMRIRIGWRVASSSNPPRRALERLLSPRPAVTTWRSWIWTAIRSGTWISFGSIPSAA